MPFTNNPSTNKNDAIRLLVGDVSTSAAGSFLSDNSYTFFYAQGRTVYGGAVLACMALAALNGGRGISKSVGDLSYHKADAKYYKVLLAEYRVLDALGVTPYAGGISISDKVSVEQNLDRMSPAFAVDEFDNPAALKPQTGASVQASTNRNF